MATALKVVPAPPEPVACLHDALVPYVTVGGYPDDITTEKGRCMACNRWYERETWASSGYITERELTSGEIRALREQEMAS
jgi:hypothetical protein